MSARMLAASSFAALSMATATPLAAADLDYYETERHSTYERGYDRDDRRADYSGRADYSDYYDTRGGCLTKHAIRDRLHADGWRDLERIDARQSTAILSARRVSSGRTFELKVDRCTGEIIDARSNRGYDEYARRY